MLDDPHIQAGLSYAYVQAITYRAGFISIRTNGDDDLDSVDITIKGKGQLEPSSILRSPSIEIQVKATYVPDFTQEDDSFSYQLNKKNYDDLRGNTHIPRLLVIFVMPRDKTQWITHSEEKLITRKCAYWYSLKGLQDIGDQQSKTLHIPTSNTFSSDSLVELMKKVARQEEF